MKTPDDRDRAAAASPRDSQPHDRVPGDADDPSAAQDERLGIWQIALSTVAAAFGVQSSRNRERDFSRGKPTHFIIAGVVFTVGFVVVMVLLVSLVLRNVGA